MCCVGDVGDCAFQIFKLPIGKHALKDAEIDPDAVLPKYLYHAVAALGIAYVVCDNDEFFSCSHYHFALYGLNLLPSLKYPAISEA